MSSLLFQIVSGIAATLVFVALLKPEIFRFLVDKKSGEPSQTRQGQHVALITTTWGFVALILSDKFPEWYGSLYALTWAGAQAVSAYLKIKGQQVPPEVK